MSHSEIDIISDKGKAGEEFVNNLAYQSFMKYWCYANPIDMEGDRKEICDLIVYFKDILILICVKNYDFKGQYQRYIKRTIEKDIRQLRGAERKIRQSPQHIVIKHPDRDETTQIDISSIKEVHRITVHFGNGMQFYPVCDTVSGDFIHIFGSDDFSLLLQELDTLPDFIDYLKARQDVFINASVVLMPDPIDENFDASHSCQFFQFMGDATQPRKTFMIDGCEPDILAGYIKNGRQFRGDLWKGDYTTISIEVKGTWDEFNSMTQVQNRKKENEKSYFIDDLVKGQLKTGGISIEVAKILLSFNRFERRCIADGFLSFLRKYNHPTSMELGRTYFKHDNIGFGFVYYPYPLCEENDEVVNSILSLACDSWMIRDNYDMEKMFIIGVTYNMQQFRFVINPNTQGLTPTQEAEIMDGAKSFGWFQNENLIPLNITEFPE